MNHVWSTLDGPLAISVHLVGAETFSTISVGHKIWTFSGTDSQLSSVGFRLYNEGLST